MLPRPTPALGLALCALLASPAPGGEPAPVASTETHSPLPSPWREALRFEFNVASEEFGKLHAASPKDPRLALAYASLLLARQPRTQGNVVAAQSILEKIAAAPGASSPDGADHAIAARLLLARIAETHLMPPRPDEARERYEALLRDHAGHALADQAAIHLAFLAAFPATGAPPALEDTLARFAALRGRVRTPEVVREMDMLEGSLLLEAGRAREALTRFAAARAVGFRQADRNSDLDLTIANLAMELGDRDRAIAHFRSFLARRPRDARATTVRRHVEELAAAATSTP